MDARGLALARWTALIEDRVHAINQSHMLSSYGRKGIDPEMQAWEHRLFAEEMPKFMAAVQAVVPALVAVDPSLTMPQPKVSIEARDFHGRTILLIGDPVPNRFVLAESYAPRDKSGLFSSIRGWDEDRAWTQALSEPELLEITAREAHRVATWLVAANALPQLVAAHPDAAEIAPADRAKIVAGALRSYAFMFSKDAVRRELNQRWGLSWGSDQDLRKLPLDQAVRLVLD